ncbi:hypothetical protein SDC9_183704 [bioreactor metagenome]|uniref:Uncharacterized protein n=1 Tax=bioreactor metagenome TaxID=1076179 RepID=A0A645HCE5_9ZZZZ
MFALEDVSPHIDTCSSTGNRVVSKRQCIPFRKFLPTRHNNRYRACRHNLFEIVAVIRLDDVRTHLCNDTGGEFEEPVRPLHILAYGNDAQHGNAVAHAGIDALREVVDARKLSLSTDECLYCNTVRVHPDGILNVDGDDLVAEIIIQHRRARRHSQRNRLAAFCRDTGP